MLLFQRGSQWEKLEPKQGYKYRGQALNGNSMSFTKIFFRSQALFIFINCNQLFLVWISWHWHLQYFGISKMIPVSPPQIDSDLNSWKNHNSQIWVLLFNYIFASFLDVKVFFFYLSLALWKLILQTRLALNLEICLP